MSTHPPGHGSFGQNSEYPRPLALRERGWIEWILPVDRAGYRQYRELIASMTVLGQGRRGAGEFILGHPGHEPDFSAPLAPVFAYGAIDSNFGTISVTLRELTDDQISFEIVSQRSEEVPAEFEESRRWTYSTWSPGDSCPQCRNAIREVSMHGAGGQARLVLVICPTDRRLWVFDAATGVNRLIPVTNFHNELMLHKNIRDPKRALDSRLMFADLPKYSDSDLTYAFLTYNTIKTKIRVADDIQTGREEKPTLFKRFIKGFRRVSP